MRKPGYSNSIQDKKYYNIKVRHIKITVHIMRNHTVQRLVKDFLLLNFYKYENINTKDMGIPKIMICILLEMEKNAPLN